MQMGAKRCKAVQCNTMQTYYQVHDGHQCCVELAMMYHFSRRKTDGVQKPELVGGSDDGQQHADCPQDGNSRHLLNALYKAQWKDEHSDNAASC